MNVTTLMSIGTHCKTAYQLRVYAKKERLSSPSCPFDWTITTLEALKRVVSVDFDPQQVLEKDNWYIGSAGSVVCKHSELCFHHHLSPALMKSYPLGQDNTFNVSLDCQLHPVVASDNWEKARQRFLHTYAKMIHCSTLPGNLYVRTVPATVMNARHRDISVHEDPYAVLESLSSFNAHPDFCLLHVVTRINRSLAPLVEAVTNLQRVSRHLIICEIEERRGWNGDQSASFKGDENAWEILMDRVLKELSRD